MHGLTSFNLELHTQYHNRYKVNQSQSHGAWTEPSRESKDSGFSTCMYEWTLNVYGAAILFSPIQQCNQTEAEEKNSHGIH